MFQTDEQLQHEHPLELVDLLSNYPRYKEYEYVDDDDNDDDDDEHDDDTKWDFCIPCNLCGKEINLYQRYYYKCSRHSCDYFLHKWCKELPKTITLRSHRNGNGCKVGTLLPHYLGYDSSNWICHICNTWHYINECLYRCPICYFYVDVKCVIPSIENPIIYHPSHPHPLIRAPTDEPISNCCDACGMKHVGHLYHCTTCIINFSVQSDCLFLSKKKLTSLHTHPLILSYSFPIEHQNAEFQPKCRICSKYFYNSWALWIYKCEKCRYYVHLDCIKSKGDHFISETGKDYEESDYPNVLNLPFRDHTDSIQKHLFFKELTSTHHTNVNVEDNLVQLTHNNCHQHPLRLVQHSDISNTSSIISLHNPREKVELLCDGCVRPITSTPFFQCTDDQGCPSFVLHEWCTRLPPELKDYYGHPQHILTFLPKVPGNQSFGVFRCRVCQFPCNGFAYGCVRCEYYIDVTCGFIPEAITHEAHPNHLFLRVDSRFNWGLCLGCLEYDYHTILYKCRTCKDVYLHPECGLLLPKKIMHKYDKHPMKLSYMPIENHKSEYFCEICEVQFDPKRWFYHCNEECAQSVHPACAPLILQSERDTYSRFDERGVYYYVNIKFGSRVVLDDNIIIKGGHSHSVLIFAQGIHDDGRCVKCDERVRYGMVFKCLECKFVIHYKCVFKIKKNR